MTELKTLSEKIINNDFMLNKIDVVDVKDFIKKLKEGIEGYPFPIYNEIPIFDFIDKLAGEDLK